MTKRMLDHADTIAFYVYTLNSTSSVTKNYPAWCRRNSFRYCGQHCACCEEMTSITRQFGSNAFFHIMGRPAQTPHTSKEVQSYEGRQVFNSRWTPDGVAAQDDLPTELSASPAQTQSTISHLFSSLGADLNSGFYHSADCTRFLDWTLHEEVSCL